MTDEYARIRDQVTAAGFQLRGGFHPRPSDDVPPVAGGTAKTLVLVGNVGPSMWRAFDIARRRNPELGLDQWTRASLDPVAQRLGAGIFYVFDGAPFHPFQQWARRAEDVHPSPLGSLIHPDYGLWHAYRAALVFDRVFALPPRGNRPSPCERCADRPCLNTCPVNAFTASGYRLADCAAYLDANPVGNCMTGACAARRACPVGREYIYPAGQRRFHMRAFRQRHR